MIEKRTKRLGRIAHHHTDATVPHIVALLGSCLSLLGFLFLYLVKQRDDGDNYAEETNEEGYKVEILFCPS